MVLFNSGRTGDLKKRVGAAGVGLCKRARRNTKAGGLRKILRIIRNRAGLSNRGLEQVAVGTAARDDRLSKRIGEAANGSAR